MNDLNFFPSYEHLLGSRKKTTTIRLGTAEYAPGEIVNLTVGWSEPGGRIIHKAEILKVYSKALRELVVGDLEGESPDCLSPEAVPFVIGCIYRKVLSGTDLVTIVKFKHIE